MNDKNSRQLKIINFFLDKLPYEGFIIIMVICCGSVLSFVWDRNCDNTIDLNMFSQIGTLITMTWTLTTSLIVVYLGLVREKKYGIRIFDILVEDFGFTKIILLGLSFLFEFIFLIWIFFQQSFIELIFCVVYQIFAVVYIFLLICRESSNHHIRNMVIQILVKEIQVEEMDDEIRRREMFLSGVIYSTENKNSMDRDELVLLYQDIIKECIALHYEDDKIQSFSRKFFEMMLRHNEISSDKHELALYLLCGISGTDKIAAQRGIFEALLCKMDDAGVNIVLETEFSNRLSILSWGMMFCILGSQSKNLQFLEIQKRKLYYYISRDPKCEEQLSIETLLLLWVELVKKYNREENGYVDFRFDLVYKGLGY